MSVFRWRYTEACEGRVCCGDCDECSYDDEDGEEWQDVRHAPLGCYYATCPKCGERMLLEKMAYCPNCGAKMIRPV